MPKGYGLMHFEMQEAAATATKKVHGMLLNGKESVSGLEEEEGIVLTTFMKFKVWLETYFIISYTSQVACGCYVPIFLVGSLYNPAVRSSICKDWHRFVSSAIIQDRYIMFVPICTVESMGLGMLTLRVGELGRWV